MERACAVLEISPSTYYAAKKREEYAHCRAGRAGEDWRKAIKRAREKKRAEAFRCEGGVA